MTQSVTTNLKTFSDIRNDIRNVISETLPLEIRNIFRISNIETYSTASVDIVSEIRNIFEYSKAFSDMLLRLA